MVKPWLIATAGGLGLGCVLLSIPWAESERSYDEPAARNAAYDVPLGPSSLVAETEAGNVAAPTTSEGVFAPAEPITAAAELTVGVGQGASH